MLDRIAAPVYGGVGTILALHRVRPEAESAELPFNRNLEITPEMLDTAIRALRKSGFTFVGMDEAVEIIGSQRRTGRFAVFSLDDGYRDNILHAAEIFRAESVPFIVYVTTCFPDSTAVLWWYLLEKLIVGSQIIEFAGETLSVQTSGEKNSVFETIAPKLAFADRRGFHDLVTSLFAPRREDLAADCREMAMSWDEIRDLSRQPLATIGAHTVSHLALSRLSEDDARAEISNSVARIEREIRQPVAHFAYPYGGRAAVGTRELRFVRDTAMQSAVTTRHGNVFVEHSRHLEALPRVPLTRRAAASSGQYLPLWTSGLVASHENRFRRVVVE